MRHRTLAELQAGLSVLAKPPAEVGRLAHIVCRRAPGVHEELECGRLTPVEGLAGDEWFRRDPHKLDAQLAVMSRDVSDLIANGQSLTLSGDNLLVDLDISAANLPAGTRLRVGKAIVEVTPKPHNGCSTFQKRFGADALRFVAAPATRHLNLRGIYWRVVEAGEVRAGDEIRVVTRPKRTGP